MTCEDRDEHIRPASSSHHIFQVLMSCSSPCASTELVNQNSGSSPAQSTLRLTLMPSAPGYHSQDTQRRKQPMRAQPGLRPSSLCPSLQCHLIASLFIIAVHVSCYFYGDDLQHLAIKTLYDPSHYFNYMRLHAATSPNCF